MEGKVATALRSNHFRKNFHLREGRIASNDLPSRLAEDERVGLSVEDIDLLISEGESRVGAAVHQVEGFLERAKSWGDRYPDAVEYKPASIL